ncbi:hypothetical protein KTT_48530 [Tengunoibacter tsumagoiensis]|uniref:Uncharacterized protein n=1 Tax=Tengunoibacter tsumagoiensis TaxID=2014871 RepID=A0A402A782_9CHLR|nr:hypothetical protein KTT_48530 [Tengunoibacter tsumagoiensis]
MIRPLQGGATVRDGQAGDVAQLRNALLLPQRLFYLNVEGTGEIINDDQVCIPRKHPRCRSTLYLSPGELDTTWANLPDTLD